MHLNVKGVAEVLRSIKLAVISAGDEQQVPPTPPPPLPSATATCTVCTHILKIAYTRRIMSVLGFTKLTLQCQLKMSPLTPVSDSGSRRKSNNEIISIQNDIELHFT